MPKCTKPIFTKFSGLVEILVGMIKLTFFFEFLKGCCHGDQIKNKSNGKIGLPHVYSSHWHSKKDRRFARRMGALTGRRLHCPVDEQFRRIERPAGSVWSSFAGVHCCWKKILPGGSPCGHRRDSCCWIDKFPRSDLVVLKNAGETFGSSTQDCSRVVHHPGVHRIQHLSVCYCDSYSKLVYFGCTVVSICLGSVLW